MRKALSYLAALVVSIGASGAWAADRAVVGMEWGFGPIVRKVPGAARFDSQATLYWKASDDFTLGVFRGDGTWAMQAGQSEEFAGGPTIWKLRKTGQVQTSGIRMLKSLPMMNLVGVGLDLGTAQFLEQTATITQDNGASPGPAATFGVPVAFNTTAALLGVVGRMSLLQASSKTITTEFSLTGSLRYAVFPALNVLGTLKDKEVGVLGTPGTTPMKAISSYHNLVISLGANIWF